MGKPMPPPALPVLPTRAGLRLLKRVQAHLARDYFNTRPPHFAAGIADQPFWDVQYLIWAAQPHFRQRGASH